jgi:hypothetical protein
METDVKTVRGKLVKFDDGSTRFFPAIHNPLGACDSALEDADDKHHAALAHAHDCSDDEAQELQDALDRRAGARDRKARAGDSESERSREEAYALERGSAVDDHRNDFASIASGGPDKRGADSRMALDRRTRSAAGLDIGAIFGAGTHPHRNHDA